MSSPESSPGDIDKDSVGKASVDGDTEADVDKKVDSEGTAPASRGKKRGRPTSRGAEQMRSSSAAAPAEGGGDQTGKTMQKKLRLTMPIHKFSKALRARSHTRRMGGGTAVIMTSVIEYVVSEILELAGNTAAESKKARIVPRHIQQAVRNDEELNKFLANVTIAGGGVIPNVHATSLPKKDKKPPRSTSAAVPIGNGGEPSTISQEY